MNKDKNNMPQGQAGPGKGGKKPGPPKPKNMKKTLKTLMSYLGKYKLQLIIVMVLIVVNSIINSHLYFSVMSSDCFHATKDIPYTTFDLVIILQ